MSKDTILKKFTEKTFSVIRKFRAIENNVIEAIEFNGNVLADVRKIKTLHNRFPTKSKMLAEHYLYTVEFSKTVSSQEISGARKVFIRERNSKSANFSRHNEQHPDSHSIYVGTSTDIKGRFRTHLGVGNGTTTWALYMNKWVQSNDVTITVVPLLNFLVDESQVLEDVIWDAYKPMCGKKGGK